MMLRLNDVEIPIVNSQLRQPPTLFEDESDKFEYLAGVNEEAQLLLDDIPLEAQRDYHNPALIRWTWEKERFGRVGFVKCVLKSASNVLATGELRVEPRKLTLADYAKVLDEINSISYNIVYDLRNTNFEHLDLVEPDRLPKSGIEWLETIRAHFGQLEQALTNINKQPHVKLERRNTERFVWEVRRPSYQLLKIMSREGIGELTDRSQPIPSQFLRLPEDISEPQTNTYENQLIAQFLEGIDSRLRSLKAQTTRSEENDLATQLLVRLEYLRSLSFLVGVTPLVQPPWPTLVLLRNFNYRSFYDIFRRFHWGLRIRLEDKAANDLFHLTTQHVYDTYELWAFFKVIEATKLAVEGRIISADNLIDLLRFDELLIRLREGCRVLIRSPSGEEVIIRYQPRYEARTSAKPHSVSLPKIPDIVMLLKGAENALVFDAKYRLESEKLQATGAGGEPKDDDINKMHIYRDSIRVGEDEHPFIHAAFILFPGTNLRLFDSETIGAIPLRPGSSLDELQHVIVNNLR